MATKPKLTHYHYTLWASIEVTKEYDDGSDEYDNITGPAMLEKYDSIADAMAALHDLDPNVMIEAGRDDDGRFYYNTESSKTVYLDEEGLG